MSDAIEIELDGDAVAPGDAVKGSVAVLEGGRARGIEVSLDYRETTGGFEGCTVRVPPASVHEGKLEKGASYEFELRLPTDALPGYRSKHGELYWAVVARVDKLGRDEVCERRLEVS